MTQFSLQSRDVIKTICCFFSFIVICHYTLIHFRFVNYQCRSAEIHFKFKICRCHSTTPHFTFKNNWCNVTIVYFTFENSECINTLYVLSFVMLECINTLRCNKYKILNEKRVKSHCDTPSKYMINEYLFFLNFIPDRVCNIPNPQFLI